MNDETQSHALADLIATARAAGIEVDGVDSVAWLRQVQNAVAAPGEFAISSDHDFGGHELAVLDFDPQSAERLRRIGAIIAVPLLDDRVQSALAIAGSAAQGRIHPFPADADFFERVHLSEPTLDAARSRLAELVRANVLAVDATSSFDLEDVWFGRSVAAALRWTMADVRAGMISESSPTGEPVTVTWDEAAADPGFVKLDWTFADPALGGRGKVSKVIDATWTAPDGSVVSLDGMIDADFQQIYLDAQGAELAAFLTRDLPTQVRDHYLDQIEREVTKYCRITPPNFVKAAKRLYNICRLTGRHHEALFLRELFDEPPARLDQIRTDLWVLVRRLQCDENRTDDNLRLLFAEIDAAWSTEEERLRATALCGRLASESDADAQISIVAEIDGMLAVATSTAFERRLRAYPPAYAAIEEILARHSA